MCAILVFSLRLKRPKWLIKVTKILIPSSHRDIKSQVTIFTIDRSCPLIRFESRYFIFSCLGCWTGSGYRNRRCGSLSPGAVPPSALLGSKI